MMNQNLGVIAAGHEATVQAGEEILRAGGNAFDAIVAAHYAACVAEPVLASLAGGGYLLAHETGKDPVVYDFFVQTPLQKNNSRDFEFIPIQANFGAVTQEFHIGAAAIATPGTVKGVFEVYRDLCSMPMAELIQPAMALAKDGLMVNSFQAYIFDIVHPILQSTPDARKLYASPGNEDGVIKTNEVFFMPELADFFEALAREGDALFYQGEVAAAIHQLSADRAGYLTRADLESYTVQKRQPLRIDYRDYSIITNPPPSSGGLLIAFALQLLQQAGLSNVSPGSFTHIHTLVEAMAQTNKARLDYHLSNYIKEGLESMLDPAFIQIYREEVLGRAQSLRGTTQLSVIDKKGNSASMTVSNGEGCGYLIPGTGVMLNNMLGEEDLNPGGFHLWATNQRMTSMMSPTLMFNLQGDSIALGSGGSNRIRTAILQVLLNMLDFNLPLETAVVCPRVHFENNLLNIEPGLPADTVSRLLQSYPQYKLWDDLNLFFGGVHAVQLKDKQFSGLGDPRRGGVVRVI